MKRAMVVIGMVIAVAGTAVGQKTRFEKIPVHITSVTTNKGDCDFDPYSECTFYFTAGFIRYGNYHISYTFECDEKSLFTGTEKAFCAVLSAGGDYPMTKYTTNVQFDTHQPGLNIALHHLGARTMIRDSSF